MRKHSGVASAVSSSWTTTGTLGQVVLKVTVEGISRRLAAVENGVRVDLEGLDVQRMQQLVEEAEET